MSCNTCCVYKQKVCDTTCRRGGRNWGRACGPCIKMSTASCRRPVWREDNQNKPCTPFRPYQRNACNFEVNGKAPHPMLCYGFGLYARKLFPCGLPCKPRYKYPSECSDNIFYPNLPTKPEKTYSNYTFKKAGAPYTCNSHKMN